MPNHTKANPHLSAELSTLRQRVAELETALAESQQALSAAQLASARDHTIINRAYDAIISIDEQQRIFLFNPAAEQMFGYTAAEMMGQSLDLLLPPSMIERHRHYVAEFLASSNESWPTDDRVGSISWRHRSGQIFPAEANFTKFKVDEQVILTIYMVDITERRQSEALLQLQHEASLAFSSTDDFITALHLLLKTITKIEGIDCGGVYLMDEATGAMNMAAHRGLLAEFVALVAHYEADTPNARLVKAGKPIYQNYGDLPMSNDPVRQREGLRGIGIIPISYEGQVIAALHTSSHTHNEIPTSTRHALETLALQLGVLLARLKAEMSFHTSQENLQALFDTIDEFVFILDMQGNILKVNPAVQQGLGYTDPEPVGRSALEIHPPERRAEAAAIMADMLAGRTDTCLIPLITTTGTLIPVETRVTQGMWNDQPALFGISRDITERLQVERALQESEASFRLFFANNPHPMWVFDMHTLEFLEVNEAAVAHFGYTRDEFLRMHTPDIRSPEEAARLIEHLRQPLPAMRASGYWQYRLKTGRLIVCDVHSHNLTFGGREAALVVAQDITERLQAEEKLRESEERFRQLAENITEVFWITDPLSPVVYISPAYETVWGRTCQSLYEQPSTFVEAVHPEDRLQFDQAMNQQYEGWRTELEYRVVRPDGSIRWVWDRGFPIFDEVGQVARIAGVAVDITERKQAEVKLRESELRFRQLAENIDQVFWMFDVSDLVYISPAYETVWGRTCQSLYEAPFSFMEAIHPDDQARLNQAIEQQFQGQRTEIEYRVIQPDGSIRWVVDRGSPIFDEQGQVYLIAGIAADMTARRQVELALTQRTQEYQTLVENIPDIVQRLDRSLRIIYSNSAFTEVFGLPVEAIIGKRYRENRLATEQADLMDETALWVFETGRSHIITVKFDSPGRPVVYHQIRFVPEFGADGAVETVLAIGRDITELKQAQAAVEGLNRTLETRVEERTAALQESEEKYRIVADYTTNWEYWRAPDGHFVYMSPSCRLITGYTVEEFQSNPNLLIQIVHPADQAMAQAHRHEFELAKPAEHPGQLEFRIITKEGQIRWLEHQCRSIHAAEGHWLGRRASNRDISPRKEAEASLQASEAQYRALVENSLLGVAILQEGCIVFANQALAQIMGLGVTDLLALSPEGVIALVHPDDQNKVQEVVMALLMGEIKASTQEFRFVQPNGNIRWGVSAATLINREGQPAIQTSYLDVTLVKQAEESLWASERRFREIFELSPVGIFIGSADGRIYRANAALCAMLGYTEAELQAKMVFELTHPTDQAQERIIFDTIMLSQESVYYEQRYLSKNGEVIWGNGASKMIFDETSQPQYGLGIITNITERKEMEEALRLTADELSLANADLARAARLKDEFLASMSHELRTPLTAILGQSEVMQEQIYGPLTQEQKQALTDIQNSGQHLLTLINDLLDLSKIEAGKLELELRPVSVAAVCQASLRLIKNQAHKKELAVAFTQDETVQILQADERRLKQILVNLLSNAVKFTPDKGSIGLEVRADSQQSEVYFTVWDTGIGIAPEDMKRLFKPFVQLDSRLSRQYTGTGLGLSLVSRLSEMHGGRVSLKSEPGQGSRFTVTLPWSGVSQHQIIQEEKSGPEASKDKAPARLIETGVILVVEDNEQVLQLLLQYLQVGGYRTIVARNGQEALRQAAQGQPKLVLMDVQMPGMDGLETIRRLRAAPDRGLARIPVIALTALAAPEDREQCLKAGADAFLPKPVRLKELIGTIERVLSGPPA